MVVDIVGSMTGVGGKLTEVLLSSLWIATAWVMTSWVLENDRMGVRTAVGNRTRGSRRGRGVGAEWFSFLLCIWQLTLTGGSWERSFELLGCLAQLNFLWSERVLIASITSTMAHGC